MVPFLGIFVFLGLAWCISENRKAVPFRTVGVNLAILFGLAVFFLKTPWGKQFQEVSGIGITFLVQCASEGAKTLFHPALVEGEYFCTAFSVVPSVILIASLTAVLFHLGILDWVIRFFAFFVARFCGVSGAEALIATANVFLGMVESPFAVRPYLRRFTRSEIFCMMTCGMATIAGGVMAAYAAMLQKAGTSPGHLVIASILSVFAAIILAKIIVPETEESFCGQEIFGVSERSASETETAAVEGQAEENLELRNEESAASPKSEIQFSRKTAAFKRFFDGAEEKKDANLLDAACRGASEGIHASIEIVGMIVAMTALIALVNLFLGSFGEVGGSPLTLQRIFSWGFAPIAWFLGIPWSECAFAGQLLGEKTILNEFLAYQDLTRPENAQLLGERSRIILTYALCGFANLGSIAIMVGGISTLMPERRKELAELAFKSLVGGTLAAFLTACFAALFI